MNDHRSTLTYVAIGGAVVVAALLFFGAPLYSLLPFAFLLICPVAMFFMMRGMSGSHGGEDHGCGDDDHRDEDRHADHHADRHTDHHEDRSATDTLSTDR